MYWFRRVHLLGLFGFLGLVGVLSVSDTAPGVAGGLIRSVFVLAARIDPFGTAGAAARVAMDAGSTGPYRTDTIGHFIMWAAAGFVAVGLFSTMKDRLSTLSALFLVSALFEAAQQYFSWSRQASFDDLVANGVGLAVGFACFGLAERLAIPRIQQLTDLGRRLGLSGSGGV